VTTPVHLSVQAPPAPLQVPRASLLGLPAGMQKLIALLGFPAANANPWPMAA